MTTRKPYPSDVTDDEWSFVAPYLALLPEDAGQREYALRDVFDALRWVIKTGAQWRYLPGDFPPWPAVYQQARRWVAAGCFEGMTHDLRELLRVAAGRNPSPSAVVLDGRTLQSTPESGTRAGFDGHKMRNGSKVHIAVDTLGHLLALRVTTGKDQERHQVADLAADVQQATGQTVTLAYADQGYTGDQPMADAAAHGITLQVIKPEPKKKATKEKRAKAKNKKEFVLLPRRWVVERSFAWMGRFRRLARDYERLTTTLAGWHWAAFVALLLHRWASVTELGS
jgi:transposase